MKAVDSLRRGFPMLSAPEISEQTLIDMYRVEVRNRIEHNPNPLGVWSSLIQILKYYGRVEESAEEKRAMLAYARTLPTTALAYPPVTPEEYERRVETQINEPLAVLLARRAEHLAKAGLGQAARRRALAPPRRLREGNQRAVLGVSNKRVNLTRPTVSVVTCSRSPRRLRAVR